MDFSKLKVLYYNSKEIQHDDNIWGFLELGIDVNRSELMITYNILNSEEIEYIENEIKNYDFVFTQDFSVNVAEACHNCHIRYISWIYDSPQIALHTDYALYDENYIFSFDKVQIKMLQDFGVKHVYYQPLGANATFQSTVKPNMEEMEKYSCDISFVGQLYRKDDLNIFFSNLNEEQKELFLRYCNIYSCKWSDEISIFDDTLDDIVATFVPHVKQSDFNYYHLDPIYITKCIFLCPFVTHFERVRILGELAKRFDTVLYTTNADYEYAKIFFAGKLNPKIPRDESYKVFRASKLNLNITLRTIESGIPLRVFDIMGMGGAVITNWQPEVDELFNPDKDIIVYHSLEELNDKVSFYLKNEKARKSIALCGKNRVLNEFNTKQSIKNILEKTLS